MEAGSITFSTVLDNKQLYKELNSLTKKIEKKERDIAELTAKRDEAKGKGALDGAVLDAEKAKLQEIKDRLDEIRTRSKDKALSLEDRDAAKELIPSVKQEYDDQKARVQGLQTEWNKTESAVERYTAQLTEAEAELDRQKEEAGHIVQQLDEAKKAAGGMGDMIDHAKARMDKLGKRILSLAASALVFNVISSALTSLQQLTMKYIKTNSEARAAIAQLKGALLTLAQPLIEVIIPAFTLLVNILTRIITAVAQFVSMLFGKTLQQSKDGAKALHKEANAIGAVGEAADEAAGSLAGFDEINQINTESAKGAGGAGAAGEEIAPDFGGWGIDEDLLGRLSEIADLVGLIGAGFALWKIGDMLPGVLGQIAQLLGGILMTVGGLLLFWNGLTDAWENGVDWLNLIEMIGGLAAAALGLYTIFELLHPGWGKIAEGIALVVGGLAMLVTGFHDAMENGWNLQNTLLSIAGLLATGLGISLITGSWIPLLVAGILSVLLALTVATGHGEELLNGIREVIEGFKDFFVGVFTGDMEKAISGISKIFEGLKKTVFSVIDGLQDTLLSFLDWLDEKTGGQFSDAIKLVKDLVSAAFGFIKDVIGTGIGYMQDVLTGLVEFIGGVFTLDWEKVWGGLQKILGAHAKAILGWIGDIIALVGKAVDAVKDFLKLDRDRGGNFGSTSSGGFGGSRMAAQALPSIAPVSIPALAKGAVIPPNREFMAVLGDQRSGTNIEAPLETIKQALAEVMQSNGSGGDIVVNITTTLDGRVLARNQVRHINDMTRQAGKPVLLI